VPSAPQRARPLRRIPRRGHRPAHRRSRPGQRASARRHPKR
jgi:hypothetical protein